MRIIDYVSELNLMLNVSEWSPNIWSSLAIYLYVIESVKGFPSQFGQLIAKKFYTLKMHRSLSFTYIQISAVHIYEIDLFYMHILTK